MRWTRGSWLGMALVPLLLAACASSAPTASASGGHETLRCTLATSIQGVDVIKQVLTCKVTGAPASETGITLSYHAEDGAGQQRLLTPACVGALNQGSGSCTQTYSTPAPMGSGPGSVAGVTEPHHHALGPVTPTPVAGTPGTTPGLPTQ
jgi:hypothetical protein